MCSFNGYMIDRFQVSGTRMIQHYHQHLQKIGRIEGSGNDITLTINQQENNVNSQLEQVPSLPVSMHGIEVTSELTFLVDNRKQMINRRQ